MGGVDGAGPGGVEVFDEFVDCAYFFAQLGEIFQGVVDGEPGVEPVVLDHLASVFGNVDEVVLVAADGVGGAG